VLLKIASFSSAFPHFFFVEPHPVRCAIRKTASYDIAFHASPTSYQIQLGISRCGT